MKNSILCFALLLLCIASSYAQNPIKIGQVVNNKAVLTVKESEVIAALAMFVKDGEISNPILSEGTDELGKFYYVKITKKRGEALTHTVVVLVYSGGDLWAAAEGCEMSCESSTCSCTQNIIRQCASQTCTCTTSGGCSSKITLFGPRTNGR
jgi:hypothetical protein